MKSSGGEVNKNITTMETSITDLQGELDVANRPSKNHFKPGWLLIAIIVALVVGFGAYFAATNLTRVEVNTEAIRRACELRNEELAVVNAKFKQLVQLFDASFANRPPDQPPPAAEVLAQYELFRMPIRLLDCENGDALDRSGMGERAQWWMGS